MLAPLACGSDGLAIGRVRLQCGGSDHLRARQRLEAHVAGVGPASIGLPHGAVLVVRRVTARAAAPISSWPDGALARAVERELGRAARLARRPWRDPDAATADAVLFADESELVACLVRDWLRHRVADRWWWREILGTATPEAWLRTHALPNGDVLAPAVSLLDPRSEAVAWTARLPDADARMATAAVERAFALPMFEPPRSTVSSAAPPDRKMEVGPAARAQVTADPAPVASVARLIGTVPEIRSEALGRPQRRLLATSLMVARAPSWARTAECAAALAAIDDGSGDIGGMQVVDRTSARRSRDAPSRRAPAVAQEMSSGGAIRLPSPSAPEVIAAKPALTIADSSATVLDETRPVVTPTRNEEPEGFRDRAVGPEWRYRSPGHAPQAREAGASSVSAPLEPDGPIHVEIVERSATERVEPQPAVQLVETRIDTEFGGLFYLLNAWLAMGVYSDFTAPRGPNAALSPWDLLALVGRAWFGAPLVESPIWTLLSELAAREADAEPGAGTPLPERWLADHLENLTVRLQQALGCAAADVPAIVCRHRARIAVTPARVQVHLALAALPLEVRIAGLDRDPGWIPAAGRAVAFHFD